MNQSETTLKTYDEALDFLNNLIDYERKPLDKESAKALILERPQKLVERVGSPQNAYPAVHIAGTKGKGSVAAMTAFCLRAAGLRVGLYTSPHLRDVRERVSVLTPDDADGRISEADFLSGINEIKTAVSLDSRQAVSPISSVTWYEVMTVLGLKYFAQQQVDIAVVETGLGGRFDATRLVNPLVCAITSLSLDHTDVLGDTLSEIAFEKAGIMKPNVPVVVAPQKAEAISRLLDVAAETGSPLTAVSAAWRYHGERKDGGQALIIDQSPAPSFIPSQTSYPMALAGDHQLQNAVVALAALNVVRSQFPNLDETAVRRGLAEVVWNGRLQTIHSSENSPTLLVDCAHNPDSIARLVEALSKHYVYDRLIFIFGAPSDKKIADMLATLVPFADLIITAAAAHPRASDPEKLAQIVQEQNGAVVAAASSADALTLAWENATAQDLICATGSIIFVGDLLNRWDSLKSHLL
ncbi:MAG: bifunctional folylpolyglutamate synthase/dihydrofolate synthase [Chloroflexi bacterium]|nr:MAG: bifunctional folylpolyglutamate synthase/dihydrofolate synthase [Chloroflexota bacterium]